MITRIVEKEKGRRKFRVGDLEFGQLVEFEYHGPYFTEGSFETHIGLKTYSCLVSLTNPSKTWVNSEASLIGRVLPAGTTLELTSEV